MTNQASSDKEKNTKDEILKRILELENEMLDSNFWADKNLAQSKIKEIQELRDALEGGEKHDKKNAILTIFAGVGGEDAEDWVRMLLQMYIKFADRKKWQINFLDENQNSNGGFKTVTFEIVGKNVFGTLKNEAGVHRLVRKSPFNSAGKRQTSFAMVEVLPEFGQDKKLDFHINPDELQIEFTKSSGPGGQNVNKRETAVRVVHKPTGISAFVSNERSQAQNKEKALEMVYGKIYKLLMEQQKNQIRDLTVSKNTDAAWGNQIRSYVLHPYKMVKDHRTKAETSNVENVLNGEIDLFICSMKQ